MAFMVINIDVHNPMDIGVQLSVEHVDFHMDIHYNSWLSMWTPIYMDSSNRDDWHGAWQRQVMLGGMPFAAV